MAQLQSHARDGPLGADDGGETEAAAAAGPGTRDLSPVPALLLPVALSQCRLTAPEQVTP